MSEKGISLHFNPYLFRPGSNPLGHLLDLNLTDNEEDILEIINDLLLYHQMIIDDEEEEDL